MEEQNSIVHEGILQSEVYRDYSNIMKRAVAGTLVLDYCKSFQVLFNNYHESLPYVGARWLIPKLYRSRIIKECDINPDINLKDNICFSSAGQFGANPRPGRERCNWENQVTFYGSWDPMTAALETFPDNEVEIQNAKYITISRFDTRTQDDMQVCTLTPNSYSLLRNFKDEYLSKSKDSLFEILTTELKYLKKDVMEIFQYGTKREKDEVVLSHLFNMLFTLNIEEKEYYKIVPKDPNFNAQFPMKDIGSEMPYITSNSLLSYISDLEAAGRKPELYLYSSVANPLYGLNIVGRQTIIESNFELAITNMYEIMKMVPEDVILKPIFRGTVKKGTDKMIWSPYKGREISIKKINAEFGVENYLP